MISNSKVYKKLCVDIVTYKTDYHKSKPIYYNMNPDVQDMKHNRSSNKFICSICLNQKCVNDNKISEFHERKSKSCPVCQHNRSSSTDEDSATTKDTGKFKNHTIMNKNSKKDVQTSKPDITQGLSLLNEVLSVLQTKKLNLNQVSNGKMNRKTIIYKDVGVSTESDLHMNVKPRLTMSKVFKYSIEDTCSTENKFTIVYSFQPDATIEPRKSIGLIKHKSSSIPQMKLEELKYSLKEKTKSKDVLEEVNRMFATVNRVEENDCINNRPMVRNGPRVLPVVKTGNFVEATVNESKMLSNKDQICKSRQDNNDYLSRGDSSVKHKHCLSCKKCVERCDDCAHMVCCHYKPNRPQTKTCICKRCINRQEKECNR